MNTKLAISRILLPVEFSERCVGASHSAAALACHFHAELVVLHAVTPPYIAYSEVNAYPPAADYYSQEYARAKSQLDEFLRDAPPGLRIERVLIEGDPARRIVDYARHGKSEGKFDLIVMPTHGYGPFRRFLLGSVTAKVLHDTECPVWTGPHLEQAPEWTGFAIRRIACALDLGPSSRDVLERAAAFAREFAADLLILHALPTSTVRAGGFTFDPAWRGQMERQAREQIARLQAELGTHGEVHIDAGDVAPALRDFAREESIDLLVIGRSHGAGILGRLRANAYAILRESPCPVVSI